MPELHPLRMVEMQLNSAAQVSARARGNATSPTQENGESKSTLRDATNESGALTAISEFGHRPRAGFTRVIRVHGRL